MVCVFIGTFLHVVYFSLSPQSLTIFFLLLIEPSLPPMLPSDVIRFQVFIIIQLAHFIVYYVTNDTFFLKFFSRMYDVTNSIWCVQNILQLD